MEKKYYLAPMWKETSVDIAACILQSPGQPGEGGGEGVGGGEED